MRFGILINLFTDCFNLFRYYGHNYIYFVEKYNYS